MSLVAVGASAADRPLAFIAARSDCFLSFRPAAPA